MTDVDGAWQSIRARAEFHDVRIHDIRHSVASMVLSLGQDLPMIGMLRGHRKVQATAGYGHFARDSVKAASERVAVRLAGDLETLPDERSN